MNKIVKSITLAGIAVSIALLNGCMITGQPRARLGSYATATPGTNFIGIDDLGRHCYGSFLFEHNGIVYTCRAGHIDIAHLRIAADYVRYLYNKTRKHLLNEDSEFTFKLNVEPSRYFVKLKYPDNWKTLSRKDKEKITREISLELSQYFAYTMTTWHEILTFYGYKCMYFLPEEPSAFSWEDIYSNLLGVRLGAQALQSKEYGFNKTMTILIKKELEELQIQPAGTAREASEKMRGKWYKGFVLVDMIERNMDIGLDDGFVTPILVPDVCKDAKPQSYPVPALDRFNQYGFAMSFEVEPKEFEKNKILRIIYPDGNGKRIQFPKHFSQIMDHTKAEAVKKGCVIMHTAN
jgi:hypothetical protein